MDQPDTFHELADAKGSILPSAKFPTVGLSVLFKTADTDKLRKGHTAVLGGVDRGLKNMTVFLEENFENTQIFYPIEKVTHWTEAVQKSKVEMTLD